MKIFHSLKSDGRASLPAIRISRGSDGFMLAVALSPGRASVTGPFASAFQAEKAGITTAQKDGVEWLMVVCEWLEDSDDGAAAPCGEARSFS